MMRSKLIIVDTNIWFSGWFFRRLPHRVIELVLNSNVQVAGSMETLAELDRVLLNFSHKVLVVKETKDMLVKLKSKMVMFQLGKIESVCRDPHDDMFLALAKVSDASFLVTGDDDLLSMNQYGEVKIVSAREYLDVFEK